MAEKNDTGGEVAEGGPLPRVSQGLQQRIVVKGLPPYLLMFVLVAFTIYLAKGLVGGKGLPLYEGPPYERSLAFHIAWAQVVTGEGTPCFDTWCGFFDALRFYPPLGNLLVLVLGVLFGSFYTGGALAFLLAFVFMTLGLFAFLHRVTGSGLVAFAATLVALGMQAVVSLVAFYWEYTRVLGDGFLLLFMALSYPILYRGEAARRPHVLGVLGALVVLTSLISAIMMALYVAMGLFLWLRRRERLRVETYSKPLPAGLLALITFGALTAWWLIPALLPYGIEHYLRIGTPFSDKIGLFVPDLLSPGLSFDYSLPGLQALFVIIVTAMLAVRRGQVDRGLLALLVVVILFALVVYGQGTRMYAYVGILLLATSLSRQTNSSPNHGKHVSGELLFSWLALVAMALLLLPPAMGVYGSKLVVDRSFADSDEYKVSQYLEDLVNSTERAYLMYGPLFRGSQWLNVFAPSVDQVGSVFQEGCVFVEECSQLDWVVKNTLDAPAFTRLADALNVTVLVVDRVWYVGGPNLAKVLEERGLLEPLGDLNANLTYSLVFLYKPPRENGVREDDGPGVLGVERLSPLECMATPAKVAGYSLSLTLGLLALLLTRFTRQE